MKRRAWSLSDAVIREGRVATLPDGTTGRIHGTWTVAGRVHLLLVPTAGERWPISHHVLAADDEIEVAA